MVLQANIIFEMLKTKNLKYEATLDNGFTTILFYMLAVWFIYRKFGFLTYPIKVKIRK